MAALGTGVSPARRGVTRQLCLREMYIRAMLAKTLSLSRRKSPPLPLRRWREFSTSRFALTAFVGFRKSGQAYYAFSTLPAAVHLFHAPPILRRIFGVQAHKWRTKRTEVGTNFKRK